MFPVWWFQLGPERQWLIKILHAHQPQGNGKHGVVDQQRCQCAAHSAHGLQAQTAKREPDGQRYLDQQRKQLQPGDQLWVAQRLIQCAVNAKQQRRWQAPSQHGQIAFDFVLKRVWHIGPAQQRIGHEQHGHAKHAGQHAQVHGLPQRPANSQWLARAALLCPQRQQGLKNAHERGIDADENG